MIALLLLLILFALCKPLRELATLFIGFVILAGLIGTAFHL